MLEQVMGYFEAGYAVYVEDSYGGYQCDDEEEIRDAMPDEDDSFRRVESVEVDELLHEVHFFVSDDE